jgi:prevent-host-death family protein
VKSVDIHEAKEHFAQLVARVERGGEVLIARAGKPVARLVPHEKHRPAPAFGADRARLEVPEDFDAPLSGAILAAFEGRKPLSALRGKIRLDPSYAHKAARARPR